MGNEGKLTVKEFEEIKMLADKAVDASNEKLTEPFFCAEAQRICCLFFPANHFIVRMNSLTKQEGLYIFLKMP